MTIPMPADYRRPDERQKLEQQQANARAYTLSTGRRVLQAPPGHSDKRGGRKPAAREPARPTEGLLKGGSQRPSDTTGAVPWWMYHYPRLWCAPRIDAWRDEMARMLVELAERAIVESGWTSEPDGLLAVLLTFAERVGEVAEALERR